MTDLQISTIGLVLCIVPALVHGVETFRPLWARWVVNWVLPVFGPGLPRPTTGLRNDEQLAMLDAALAAAPEPKRLAATDYLFLLLFEQRQGGLAFLSVAAGAIYGLSQPLAERDALHLMFGVMAVLFMLVNANHAGLPLLGRHPRISRAGRNVGIVFAPFWAVAAVLNWLSVSASFS